jgi:hypothetical protein
MSELQSAKAPPQQSEAVTDEILRVIIEEKNRGYFRFATVFPFPIFASAVSIS